MELNYAKLQRSLHELVEIKGIKPAEITRESKVWNIKKMIEGKCEPTLNSWDRLHKTYPGDIPPPEYTNGSYVLVTADNQSQAAGRSIINPGNGIILSPEEQAMVNALRSFGDSEARVIRKLLGMIDDIADNLQK